MTFVPVSRVSGRVEVEDIIAAVRPATCLISVMLANNETGVIMVGLPRISCAFLKSSYDRDLQPEAPDHMDRFCSSIVAP